VDLLIMDEATSSLDSETETMIQQNIDALKGELTIIIIAHRLSTVRNTDKIVVMSKGGIEQIGTYENLIDTSPLFKKMVAYQKV
ncbi:MAG: ABC transporter ATP-binding protein, partial [Flagellimonas marinaquae]